MSDNRKRALTFPRATVARPQVEVEARAKEALGATDVQILVDTENDLWVLVYTLPEPAGDDP